MFCSVERSADDPRRPADFRTNDAFWSRRGYRRQDDMLCELEWQEIDGLAPTTQHLCFWLRSLESR